MTARLYGQAKPPSVTPIAPVRSDVLQRKCECGATPGPSQKCVACQRKLSLGGTLQTKLRISQPGDRFEQEADRVADQVMRMPEPGLQRQVDPEEEEEILQTKLLVNPLRSVVQRQTNGEEEEEELLQTQPRVQRQVAGRGDSSHAPPIVYEVLRSAGQPLDSGTLTFMESRLGHDFSQVRVHTDAEAAESARAVHARAYTVGRDVVFGKGEYRAGTDRGWRLLAHELTHVIQQNRQSQERPMLHRWSISGNTATSDSSSDYLGRLAQQVGASFRDWKCIKPITMKTYASGRAPADFNKRYERYVRIGDQFDISNLTETNGKQLNLHLFDDGSEKLDADLAKLFYPGSQSTLDADADIDSASNSGSTPIGSMVIFGHAGGHSMWGNASTFTPSNYKSEEPAHSYTLASVGLFPRRCWFTRNAKVRSVGCDSTDWGNDFAASYLRKGAEVETTTESVWSRCGGNAFDPATNSCKAYNGVDFRNSPVAPAIVLEGPFWSAADFHAGSYWNTLNGKL